MTIEELINFLQEKWKVLAVVLAAIVGILIFLWVDQTATPKNQEEPTEMDYYEQLIATEIQEDEGEDITEETPTEEPQLPSEVIVDVKGAVNAPGVYQMEPNSRIVDAVEKAGGLLETAEQNAVNLAQVVEDQMVIYVPEIGEEGFDMQPINPISEGTSNQQETEPNKVDINTADKEALKTLSGIGDTKAANIIAYREEKGLFQSIEEIKNVSGIGEATFENLKDDITVSR